MAMASLALPVLILVTRSIVRYIMFFSFYMVIRAGIRTCNSTIWIVIENGSYFEVIISFDFLNARLNLILFYEVHGYFNNI